MVTFQEMIYALEGIGFMDVILPFFLIFVVVYAVLARTNIMGKEKKPFNIVIALVMAFAVVVPHVMGYYPPNADIVNIINRALPNIAIIIIAIIMALLLIGVLGGKAPATIPGGVAILAFIAVLFVFGLAAGWWGRGWPSWLSWLRDPTTQALIIVILVFGLIVWFITREEKPVTAGGRFIDQIGKWFKGD